MDPKLTPPPLPYRPVHSLGSKIAIIGTVCVLSIFVSMIIYGILNHQSPHNKGILGEMLTEYGDDVYINGPILYAGDFSNLDDGPDIFACNVKVDNKRVRRNFYELESFKAHVSISGTIDRHKLEVPVIDSKQSDKVPLDSPVYKTNDILTLRLETDPRQVSELTPLTIGGKTVEWKRPAQDLCAHVSISDMPEIMEYSTDFIVRGTGSINITQAGRKSDISIEGNTENITFGGESQPDEKNAGNGHFTAHWSVDRDYAVPSYFHVPSYFQTTYAHIGVDFPLGVGQYRKICRSVKSSFVIFVMVLIFVLTSERIIRREIRLPSYILIAGTIVLFFILLFSLSNIMAFDIAYLIASLLAIGMITEYLRRLLHSKKACIITACGLSVLFLCYYIMVCFPALSILMGTILLTTAIIALMVITLK